MASLASIFQSARREYQAANYPGDLATDVLSARWRWILAGWVAGVAAVAALVGVALLLREPSAQIPILPSVPDIPLDRTVETPAPAALPRWSGASVSIAHLQGPVVPEPPPWPVDVVIVPPAQSLLAPVVPSFWSSSNTSDRLKDSTPTSQEAL